MRAAEHVDRVELQHANPIDDAAYLAGVDSARRPGISEPLSSQSDSSSRVDRKSLHLCGHRDTVTELIAPPLAR